MCILKSSVPTDKSRRRFLAALVFLGGTGSQKRCIYCVQANALRQKRGRTTNLPSMQSSHLGQMLGAQAADAARTAAQACIADPQVGDVLYMPKGTVHQAVALADVRGGAGGCKAAAGRKGDSPPHSAHLTLSTYNR